MKRLYSLDALRGIAALSVVLWHWQHFFAITGTWQSGWQKSAEPFYQPLRLFYDAGWAAVDLFFALSGFVFFWLYGEAIASRAIRGGRFAILRASRLYPLHFATLMLVACLQFLFHRETGKFFVYDANTLKHFLSSLIMAQQWLPPTLDQSFNGPTWSVSIEVLLYAIFFLFIRAGLKGMRAALDIAAFGVVLMFLFNVMIGRGLAGFFIGGGTYYLTEHVRARADASRVARWIACLALLAWAVVVLDVYVGFLEAAYRLAIGPLPANVVQVLQVERPNVLLLGFILVVSPLTIAALALHETVLGGRYTRLSFLGDISYSSYLIHFPMQLTLAILAMHFGWHSSAFQHGWVLGAFYAVLIALASASYKFFERPLQTAIRRFQRPSLFPAE